MRTLTTNAKFQLNISPKLCQLGQKTHGQRCKYQNWWIMMILCEKCAKPINTSFMLRYSIPEKLCCTSGGGVEPGFDRWLDCHRRPLGSELNYWILKFYSHLVKFRILISTNRILIRLEPISDSNVNKITLLAFINFEMIPVGFWILKLTNGTWTYDVKFYIVGKLCIKFHYI